MKYDQLRRFFVLAIVIMATCMAVPAYARLLTVGNNHTCFSQLETGRYQPYCWGDNSYGQLGVGYDLSTHLVPSPMILFGFSALDISANGYNTCIVVNPNYNYVFCFGTNQRGNLGIGTTDLLPHPNINDTQLSAPGSAIQLSWSAVSVGATHVCAVDFRPLDIYGGVKCWGNGTEGQIGDNNAAIRPSPTSAFLPGNVVAQSVTAGTNHSCMYYGESGESTYCWGNNSSGQLGVGDFFEKPVPTLVTSPVFEGSSRQPIIVAAGNQFTCAVLYNHTIACWGDAKKGELGTDVNSNQATPILVKKDNIPLNGAISIATGDSHACALINNDNLQTQTGGVFCWGANNEGQLGIGSSDYGHPSPLPVLGLKENVIAIAAGGNQTCAILQDQAGNNGVRCWGGNSAGQLGTGDTRPRNTPTMTAKTELSAGDPLFISTFE